MKLSNLANIVSTATELLTPEKQQSAPTQQHGGATHNPAAWSGAQNLGRNSLMGKLNAFAGIPLGKAGSASYGTAPNGQPGINRNSIADQLESMADAIGKNHKGPMKFLGFNTQISLLRSTLDLLADVVRKDKNNRSEQEQIAVDYHDWKTGHPYHPGGVPFNPSAEQIYTDLNARPDIRLRLMRQSSWQDADLQLMKQSIDDCLKGMNNPRTYAASIDRFNKGPYAVHCGPIDPADPGTRKHYEMLSRAIGDELA